MHANSPENEKSTPIESTILSYPGQSDSIPKHQIFNQPSGFGYVYIPGLLRGISWFIFIFHAALAAWIATNYGNLDSAYIQNINSWAILTSTAFMVQGIVISVSCYFISLVIERSDLKIRTTIASVLESVSEALHTPLENVSLAIPRKMNHEIQSKS